MRIGILAFWRTKRRHCFLVRAGRALVREVIAIPQLMTCIFARFFFKQKVIVVSACAFYERFGFFRGRLQHNNWGDDINVYFFELLSGKKVLVYPLTRFANLIPLRRFALIGTLITGIRLNNCEICGTGAWGKDDERLRQKLRPRVVHFVRGPLTRDVLLAKGIPCPEAYGDPALLLPLFYAPKWAKRWKIALVPHYADVDDSMVSNILRCYGDDAVLVRMRGYEKWTDVIDYICASELVISSSLHGLIVAETYGVPAVWVRFTGRDHVSYKYQDFFRSIHKNIESPVDITSVGQIDMLYDTERLSWQYSSIDRETLLRLLPMELQGNAEKLNTNKYTNKNVVCTGGGK